MRDNSHHYRELFLNDIPLMDVRAPIEYQKGAFPATLNLPLMNDIERQKVGTCYKQQGQTAAIALGHQLVSGTTKAQRIAAWADFARQHPDGYLYCFRGGLRSQITQKWLLEEAGIHYPRVIGGYKAMRNFLLRTLEDAVAQCQFIVVGGLTGTGKTDVLLQLAHSLDLEHHAHHRGSSFGKHVLGQPAQIDFENSVAIDLLKKRANGHQRFVVEDESRLIGSCNLPLTLHHAMQQAPVVWLEDSLDNRVARIRRDYVHKLCAEFVAEYGADAGVPLYADRLRHSLSRIAKRLGDQRYRRLANTLDAALELQQQGDLSLHDEWIRALLVEYYDPMYAYQQQHKGKRVQFKGDQAAVVAYLRDTKLF